MERLLLRNWLLTTWSSSGSSPFKHGSKYAKSSSNYFMVFFIIKENKKEEKEI